MASARDEFSQDVIRRLQDSVCLRCSNPDCEVPTKGGHSTDARAISVGSASHIHAAAEGGPRFDASQTDEQRRSFENGIWLCATCARLIDSDVERFPAELLRAWNVLARHQAAERIGKPQPVRPEASSSDSGALHALILEVEILRDCAYEINVRQSPRHLRAEGSYDLSRISDLLTKLPDVLKDRASVENVKCIRYWAARPTDLNAARMILSESERLLESLAERAKGAPG